MPDAVMQNMTASHDESASNPSKSAAILLARHWQVKTFSNAQRLRHCPSTVRKIAPSYCYQLSQRPPHRNLVALRQQLQLVGDPQHSLVFEHAANAF
jgi:hypothetical protein